MQDVANAHMRIQLMELNETTSWIFKVKKISKMFKYHAYGPPIDKWDMCKKVDLKKSKNNSTFVVS
jgi:hypothetical protein